MEDAVGAVVGLGDDRGDGRPDEVEIHLVADLLECAADDGDGDRVHAHAPRRGPNPGSSARAGAPSPPGAVSATSRLPAPSTLAVMPGSITVVVSACSTTAGPVMTEPGPRSA